MKSNQFWMLKTDYFSCGSDSQSTVRTYKILRAMNCVGTEVGGFWEAIGFSKLTV